MQTFLFYDIETTGLNKAFDQVLHFAAIRTDLHLQEIERHEIKVKLNRDITPAPAALITHHMGIKENSDGVSEFDAIKQIHRLFNTPGTISLGYNTLGFDDEFLRFSFYRNLLPPYTHQFANQCSRADIYPLAIFYFLFKNHVLEWPTHNNKTSLKLENLKTANQLFVGRSHHAMVDVEVTLALAQRFIQENDMWDHMLGYFNKQTDQTRSRAQVGEDALMCYGKLGSDLNFLSPVLFLGQHRHYKNQSLWLRLDTENLIATTADTIKETTWVARKKMGEPGFILPLKDRYSDKLKPGILSRVNANKKWLEDNSELFKKIVEHHVEEKYPDYPDTDVEASLYLNGFWSAEEENFCRRFHQVTPKEKASLTEQVRNPRLKKLAIRLLGRHFPDVLTSDQAEEFDAYLQKARTENDAEIMMDYRGEKRMTPKKALEQITELRKQENLSEEQKNLLTELEDYLA